MQNRNRPLSIARAAWRRGASRSAKLGRALLKGLVASSAAAAAALHPELMLQSSWPATDEDPARPQAGRTDREG